MQRLITYNAHTRKKRRMSKDNAGWRRSMCACGCADVHMYKFCISGLRVYICTCGSRRRKDTPHADMREIILNIYVGMSSLPRIIWNVKYSQTNCAEPKMTRGKELPGIKASESALGMSNMYKHQTSERGMLRIFDAGKTMSLTCLKVFINASMWCKS